MALTDLFVRQVKTGDKPKKYSDSSGLYLHVTPAGGKWWRLAYRFQAKQKLISLGTYPDISLAEARKRRDEARRLLANGIDPSEHRKTASEVSPDTFEAVAREWFAKYSQNWAPSHADKILRRLERDIFPWIGAKPIKEVKTPELLTCLRRIENRGALETAHRALQNCGQICRYATATGRSERDISADLRGALPPAKEKHHAAITDPQAVGALLRAIDSYEGSLVTKCALRLAPLVFVRPGELRKADWSEFDLKRGEWNIPPERMKTREPHLVPLSRQAIDILQELQALTGNGKYVFPGARTKNRPMSDNAVLAALRRMGYAKDEMSGHGFRAMARTILDEVLHIRPDFIEHQLAHAVRDPNGRAYNRTAHLEERRAMMQRWAEYLDELKANGVVVPLIAA